MQNKCFHLDAIHSSWLPDIMVDLLNSDFKENVSVLNLFFVFIVWLVGWLVGWFGVNGPLRQYFSLYRAVFQRGRKKRDKKINEKCPNYPHPHLLQAK